MSAEATGDSSPDGCGSQEGEDMRDLLADSSVLVVGTFLPAKTSFLVVQLVGLVGQECAFPTRVHVSLYSSTIPGVFC